MKLSWDPGKRLDTLAARGLDFKDAATVLAGVTREFEDRRREYGERRFVAYGFLGNRMVVIVYTIRGGVVHVFSMRKANEREQARVAPLFEV